MGAGGAGFGAHTGSSGGAFGLAGLATFGIVAELLLLEKQLLSGGEGEFAAAIDAFENFVGKLHFRVPPGHSSRVEQGRSSRAFPCGDRSERAKRAPNLAAHPPSDDANLNAGARAAKCGAAQEDFSCAAVNP